MSDTLAPVSVHPQIPDAVLARILLRRDRLRRNALREAEHALKIARGKAITADEVRDRLTALEAATAPRKAHGALLSAREAAEQLGIHEKTLRKYAIDGRIRYSRLGDDPVYGRLRFTQGDLDAFKHSKAGEPSRAAAIIEELRARPR